MADAEQDGDVPMTDAGGIDDVDADPVTESGNSDTESGADLSDDDDDDAPAKSLEERLAEALVQKDSGNGHFKAGENTEAEKAYRDALSALGKVDSSAHAAESGGPEAEARKLFLSLHLNLSAVRLKLESWRDAARSAREALAIESSSPKARYRLGVALSRMGEFAEAKSLLIAVCKEDTKNKAARRELADLKERAKARAAEEKARMANMFAAGGKSLYADKEEEREQKAREAEAKKKREAEAAAAKDAKLHEDWDKECERREAASEAPVTFEDFKKAAEDKEKKEKEEREKELKRKKEEQEKAKREAREAARRQREADGHVVRVDDEDDLKGVNMRGYKKKADGETTTSFFDREISSSERALIGDIAPQKITADSPQALSASGARRKSGVGSDWNQAGQTWEEKDVTDWATSTLKTKLAAVRASCGGMDLEKDPGKLLDAFKGTDLGLGAGEAEDGAGVDDTMAKLGALSTSLARIEAKVTEVKTLTGDASVAVIRGTKRALFNLEAELKWSATMDLSLGGLGGAGLGDAGDDAAQGRSHTFRGTMKLPELSSSAMGESNASTGEAFDPVTTFSKKAGPRTPEERKRLDEALSALKVEMASAVERFMAEMKER